MFDVVLSSPLQLTGKYDSIHDMIFSTQCDSELEKSIIVGANALDDKPIRLRDIQNAVYQTQKWCRKQKFIAGDTIALIRFSQTSEVPLALSLLSFLACGLRVYLPQDNDNLDFVTTSTKAIVGCLHENIQREQDYSLPLYCVYKDLRLFNCGTKTDIPIIEKQQPAIIFTTSGSTGLPKFVLYTHEALINCGKAWEQAGLFSEKTTGGASLCPTLSHTMGVRNLLGALWNRRHTLFIYREWFNEPQKIEKWLLRYPPQHITCGSALFFLLHKFKVQSPALRSSLNSNLRCIVASGCKVAENLQKLFPDVIVANAFGTTETQQVMNSILVETVDSYCLGKPLPGVQIAIRFIEEQRGQLFVNSSFSSQQYLNDQPFSKWIATGDIVEYQDDKVYFVARENETIVNNGLGLKISMSRIRDAYNALLPMYSKVFFVHPKNPGIIALVFIPDFDGDISTLKRQAQSELDAFLCINDSWRDRAPLSAIGVVQENIPISTIGKVNVLQIKEQYADFVNIIADAQLTNPYKIFLNSKKLLAYSYHQPKIGYLLETLNLVRNYTCGDGNYLHTKEGEKILDVVGGFSCNLLGYNNEIIRCQLQQNAQHIFLDQANIRHSATLLSQEIARIMAKNTGKSYVACWASTGSEAVEIAIKHAWFAKQKFQSSILQKMEQVFVPQHISDMCLDSYRKSNGTPVIVALRNAFHGRTLGAMSVLNNKQRNVFSSLFGVQTVFIDEDCDVIKLRNEHQATILIPKLCEGEWLLQKMIVNNIFAVIVEPIQGEGGIREISSEFLRSLQLLNAPVIMDEIQSGLGRSGSFFASSPIVGDYYVLGKALGASLAKISLTLIEKSQYIEDFDAQRTSTFAEDSFSCQIALGVLRTIESDNIAKRCEVIGQKLKNKLCKLQNDYSTVLNKISGRGCMVGIELSYPGKNYLLQQLIAPQIGYFCASYLLNHHDVRILPTSSAPNMLRIQPSAYTTDEEIDILINALKDLCQALSENSMINIIGHLVQEPQKLIARSPFCFSLKKPMVKKRVAFIHHPLNLTRELLAYFPECAQISIGKRRDLSTIFCELSELQPIITFSDHLHQNQVWLMGIALPAPPAFFKESLLRNEYEIIEQRIQEAINLAVENSCQTIVLGGYTSIIAQKSRKIHIPENIQITSGNTYTVAIAWNELQNYLAKYRRSLNNCCVGIVGALGNIGRGYCRLLAQHDCQKLVMVGSLSSVDRLRAFEREINNSVSTSDLQQLDCCDIIIVASNHYIPIVFSEHISQTKQVFIQDLSQPANVDSSVCKQNNVSLLSSGLVRLPHDKEFRLNPSLPRGVCFACTAEGIVLSLSKYKPRCSWEIYPEDILSLLEEGKKQQLISTTPSLFR